MKKLLSLFVILLSGILLISCNNSGNNSDNKEFNNDKDSFLTALDSQLKPDDSPLELKTSVQLSTKYQDKYTISYDITQDKEYVKTSNSTPGFELVYINMDVLDATPQNITIKATFKSDADESLKYDEIYNITAVNEVKKVNFDTIIKERQVNKDENIAISDALVVSIMGRTVVLQSNDGNVLNVYDRSEAFGKAVKVGSVYTVIGLNVSQYNNNNQLVPNNPAIIETSTREKSVQPASIKYLANVTDANYLGNSPINNKLLQVDAKVLVSGSGKNAMFSLQDPNDKKSVITVSKYISDDIKTQLEALKDQTAHLYISKYAFDGGKYQAAVLNTTAPELTADQLKVVALYNTAASFKLAVRDNNADNSSVFVNTKDGATVAYAFPEGEEHKNLELTNTFPVASLQANEIVNLVVDITLTKDSVSVTLPVNVKLGHSNIITPLSDFFVADKLSEGDEVNVEGIVMFKGKYGYVITSEDSLSNILVSLKSGLDEGKKYKFTGNVGFHYGAPQLNNVTVEGSAMNVTTLPQAITVTKTEGTETKYYYALLTISDELTVKSYSKNRLTLEGANDLDYSLYIPDGDSLAQDYKAGQKVRITNARQVGINTKYKSVNLEINKMTGYETTVTVVS